LSNIIRTNHKTSNDKFVIQTKKIEVKNIPKEEPIIDPINKKQDLIQEIEALESRYRELYSQITNEKQESQKQIEQWWKEKQKEADQLFQQTIEEATKSGFQSGFEQGMKEAEQQYEEKRHQIQKLIEAAYVEKDKIIQSSEPILLSLSVKIAEKIIKKELSQDQELLVHIVKQALNSIEESENITIQVSPEDYPILRPYAEELQNYVKADSTLKIVPSSSVTIGGCMIHSQNGSYDVTIDGQLEEIKRQLLALCEENIGDEH